MRGFFFVISFLWSIFLFLFFLIIDKKTVIIYWFQWGSWVLFYRPNLLLFFSFIWITFFHLFYIISENLTVIKKNANYLRENSSFERVQWLSQREGQPHRGLASDEESHHFPPWFCSVSLFLADVVSLSTPDLSLVFFWIHFSPSELFFHNSLTYAHRERSSQTPSCPVFHINRDNAAFS